MCLRVKLIFFFSFFFTAECFTPTGLSSVLVNNLSIPCVYRADQYALQAAGRTESWGVIRADASGCHAARSPGGRANPDAHLSALIRRAEAQFRCTNKNKM